MAVAPVPMSAVETGNEGKGPESSVLWLDTDLERALAVGWSWADASHALASEALAFWHRRLKEVLATVGRLTACRTVQDVIEVQQDHVTATGHAYLDHGSRVSALLIRAVFDAPRDGVVRPQGWRRDETG